MGVPEPGKSIVHESQSTPGLLTRWILIKLDRHDLTEKDLWRVYPTTNERKPAVAFELTKEGSEKMGGLTREHLPEEGGTFRYRMGIILDDRLLSAPVILDEIRSAGIINLGSDARPEEVDHIIQVLRAKSN